MQGLYWMIKGVIVANIKLVFILTIPIYTIILLVDKMILKNNKSKYKYFIDFCFTGYIISVLILTEVLSKNLFSFSSMKLTPNLIPLVSILSNFINYPMGVLEQVLLNIIFFVPFGFFFMFKNITEKKIFKITIIASLFSLGIEILQYFSGRYADIDDIIWNTLGTVLGIGLFIVVKNIYNRMINTKQIKVR
ncbi:VanZ family protein [Clostridium mediterraneense]|uniref:VanZ family protein n=1 Tax=Clostridium mediterraneense TaxID=1805472 RepID=UPI0008318E1A|nr:VanZ family protein [Clostridium mediterraneense]